MIDVNPPSFPSSREEKGSGVTSPNPWASSRSMGRPMKSQSSIYWTENKYFNSPTILLSYTNNYKVYIQWNVSYPNMSGLNPVHNYEYFVSLKLNTQHTTLSFLGSYRQHSQNHSASRVTNEETTIEQQNLKKPNHQRSSVAKYTHVERSSHATDVT